VSQDCGFVVHQKCLENAKLLECPIRSDLQGATMSMKMRRKNEEIIQHEKQHEQQKNKYSKGEYEVILKLVDILEDGEIRKFEVDQVFVCN
jgi:hypothetical protein